MASSNTLDCNPLRGEPENQTTQPSPTARAAGNIHEVFRFCLGFVVCLTVLAVFVALDPAKSSAGLDPSWMFAMNQAVARGLVFGKNIVFTFGPYASIYTKLYRPATDGLMIGGSLFLGIGYTLLLLLLGKGKKYYALLFYAVFLACFMDSRDSLLFTYPLLLSLVVYRMTLPEVHSLRLHLDGSVQTGSLFLFAPLGCSGCQGGPAPASRPQTPTGTRGN